MKTETLETWIHEKIPISSTLQFKIQKVLPGEVELAIPLAPHRNHKGTAFGGSLYNACVLACYCLAHHDLSAAKVSTEQFVIADGHIKYLKPVTQDFEVHVHWPDRDREPVLKSMSLKGRVRWNLRAEVFCEGQKCVEFEGRFVLP